MRRGVSDLITAQPDMKVVLEVADGCDALDAVASHAFDVLLLDIAMPRLNGMEVLRRLQIEEPLVRVVILSMYPEEQYAARLLESGAAAYVSKDAPPDELLRAIRVVAAGRRWTAAAPVVPPTEGPTLKRHHSLTPREHQVFMLVIRGRTVAEIAAELDLSSSTISNHLTQVREKLGVRTTVDVVRYAMQAGLTDLPILKG